jgi:hypothetical protein
MATSEQNFDKPWQLPEKFRLSADLDSERQKEILRQSEDKQKEWKSLYGQPFAQTSPQIRERARAVILKDEYEAYGIENLVESQRTELAEAYAILGHFDRAAELAPTTELKVEYVQVWSAVWRDDSAWCAHGKSSQFAEKDIYSVKHNADALLLRCNECGERNVAPTPKHIVDGRKKRQSVRESFSGLKPLEAKKEMENG